MDLDDYNTKYTRYFTYNISFFYQAQKVTDKI